MLYGLRCDDDVADSRYQIEEEEVGVELKSKYGEVGQTTCFNVATWRQHPQPEPSNTEIYLAKAGSFINLQFLHFARDFKHNLSFAGMTGCRPCSLLLLLTPISIFRRTRPSYYHIIYQVALNNIKYSHPTFLSSWLL